MCSRYLLITWLQSTVENLASFSHVTFAAAIVQCIQGDAYAGDDNILAKVGMLLLAICTGICVVLGNARKAYMAVKHLRAQPAIHKLLPNTYRNS